MRKLKEFRGEAAIEAMGDILEPATIILGDGHIKELVQGKASRVKTITYALKTYKREVLQIMAVLDGVDINNEEEYTEYTNGVNILTLPIKLLELLNDPELQSLFTSQEWMEGVIASTPVSESSQEVETLQ